MKHITMRIQMAKDDIKLTGKRPKNGDKKIDENESRV